MQTQPNIRWSMVVVTAIDCRIPTTFGGRTYSCWPRQMPKYQGARGPIDIRQSSALSGTQKVHVVKKDGHLL